MRFLVLFFLIFVPSIVFSAGADLAISADDIRFSNETLIAGDTVRLYARITNVGTEDVLGFVTFFQSTTILGNSQTISVLAGGVPEEVYIDFTVPSGAFNIRAEIQGTDPEDTNLSNNTAITGMFEPSFDQDHDGIVDAKDNCVSLGNADQTDSDSDGLGDPCDEDDDNDGLTDEVEAELGSKPTQTDTDTDGVSDSKDSFPNDSKQSELSQTFSKIVNQVVEDLKKQESQKSEPVVEVEPLTFSSHAIFGYSRDSWNIFTFSLIGPTENTFQYEWNFGDGVRSNRTNVTHTYQKSGAYEVALTMTDENGLSQKETTTVLVPFFSLQNRFVLALIGLLTALLAIGWFAFWKLRNK
ncbi:PKD domain-containing protein [Candidatus Uhrbacteria bacterium]|nr:PKD domain-containing protein [Candidatus Uhrbacteria bacterium]